MDGVVDPEAIGLFGGGVGSLGKGRVDVTTTTVVEGDESGGDGG